MMELKEIICVKQIKKNILLLGNPQSIFILQYVENVLEPLGFDVYMQFDFSELRDDVKQFFLEHNVKQIRLYKKEDKKIFSFPFIGKWIKRLYNFHVWRNLFTFDFIHIQSVTLDRLLRVQLVKKKKSTKFFVSFWGSDLLSVSDKTLFLEKIFLKKYNCISLTSAFMRDKYIEKFYDMKNNYEIAYFGASLLPIIDKWTNNSQVLLEKYKLAKEKIIISIGYNGCCEQQHDKVIEVLKTLKNKSNYFLVIQNSYANLNKVYTNKIKFVLESSGFEYKIISNFLSMDELAKLRVITDVFINAQTTDAFCNSIKEYMYSKTQIINASWLHYPEIDTLKLNINEFSDFSEIPALLDKPLSEEKLEWNREIIGKNSSWDTCREKWAEIYGINEGGKQL